MSIEGVRKVLRQRHCTGIDCDDCVGLYRDCYRADNFAPTRQHGGLDATSRAKLKAYIEREETKMKGEPRIRNELAELRAKNARLRAKVEAAEAKKSKYVIRWDDGNTNYRTVALRSATAPEDWNHVIACPEPVLDALRAAGVPLPE